MDMVQLIEWAAYYEWKADQQEERRLEAKADRNRERAKGQV